MQAYNKSFRSFIKRVIYMLLITKQRISSWLCKYIITLNNTNKKIKK